MDTNSISRTRERLSVTFLEADPNGAAVSQTPSAGGAQYMILAGAYVSSFTQAVIPAVIGTGLAIRVTSDAAETANITITGELNEAVVSETLALPSSTTADTTQLFDRITSLSLDGASAGNVKVGTVADDDGIILNTTLSAGSQATTGVFKSGIPVLTTETQGARRLLLTTVADETAKTFTVKGTNRYGQPITETITGVNNTTVSSILDFQTIIWAKVSANTAGAIIIGTTDKASSKWTAMDYSEYSEKNTLVALLNESDAPTAYNYSVECLFNDTYVNEESQYADIRKVAVNEKDTFNSDFDIVDAFSHATIKDHVAAVRITLNSYTSAGSFDEVLNLDIIRLLGGNR